MRDLRSHFACLSRIKHEIVCKFKGMKVIMKPKNLMITVPVAFALAYGPAAEVALRLENSICRARQGNISHSSFQLHSRKLSRNLHLGYLKRHNPAWELDVTGASWLLFNSPLGALNQRINETKSSGNSGLLHQVQLHTAASQIVHISYIIGYYLVVLPVLDFNSL